MSFMSVSLYGSRCETVVHYASHMGIKRLRLSSPQNTEHLGCRHLGKVDNRRLWANRRFGNYSRTASIAVKKTWKSKTLKTLNALRPVPDPYTPKSHYRPFSTTTTHHHSPSSSSTTTSSVLASEVSHFSRLASTWWDPHGPSRLLHLMNPLRHDFIRTCLSTTTTITTLPPSTHSYLDIGCGGGIFSTSCALLPTTSSVTAIDPTPACIQAAQSHARNDPALSPPPTGKLTYINTSIESLLPTSHPPISIVTLFEVLEHVPPSSLASFLSNASSHLQPSGWLIGSTIARSPVSYITTKLIAEAPLIGVVPRGTHDWSQYINPSEIASHFETGGSVPGKWGPVVTQGVVYVPGLGWKVVEGSEGWGNYFFGVQKLE